MGSGIDYLSTEAENMIEMIIKHATIMLEWIISPAAWK